MAAPAQPHTNLYEDLELGWGARRRSLSLGGAIYHLGMCLGEHLAQPRGSATRRWTRRNVARDVAFAVARIGRQPDSSFYRLFAVTDMASAFFTLRAKARDTGPQAALASHLYTIEGVALAWDQLLLRPEAKVSRAALLPTAVLTAAALGAGVGPRAAARHVLVESLTTLGQLAGGNAFRRAFENATHEAAEAARRTGLLRAEEAGIAGRDQAANELFLWLHQQLLTTLNEVRLRAEQLATSDDPEFAAVAQAAAEAEAEIRRHVYDLILRAETVPLGAMLGRLFARRDAAGHETEWRGEPLDPSVKLSRDVALALDRVIASCLLDHPDRLELGVTVTSGHAELVTVGTFSVAPAPAVVRSLGDGRARLFMELPCA